MRMIVMCCGTGAIYKIACGRVPLANEELLASQPTITRLENQVSQGEVAAMRSRMVQGFIEGYSDAPEEIVLDIDGWADPTHGEQQLSCFHGYYGQHMYFPVLINEAHSGYSATRSAPNELFFASRA